jgi:hypothetical protein
VNAAPDSTTEDTDKILNEYGYIVVIVACLHGDATELVRAVLDAPPQRSEAPTPVLPEGTDGGSPPSPALRLDACRRARGPEA